MKIGIFYGYELTGSGSNKYTRYLVLSLLNAKSKEDSIGEIHIICRGSKPELIDFISRTYRWYYKGKADLLFKREPWPCRREYILH